MGKIHFHCSESVEKRLRIYHGNNPPAWLKGKNPESKTHGVSKAIVQGLGRYQHLLDTYKGMALKKFTKDELDFIIQAFGNSEISDDVTNILQQKIIEVKDDETKINKKELLDKIYTLELIDKLCIVEYIQDYQWMLIARKETNE